VVRQQENLLKNALSRNGLEDPLVDTAEVVPLDSIQVPERDDLPALRELVATAMAKRPDVALSKINQETAEISAVEQPTACCRSCRARLRSPTVVCPVLPTRNQTAARLIPIMSVAWEMRWAKSSGRISPAAAPRCFRGQLAQRVAQGDYGIDQLQLRQSELVTRRSMNQLVVDISNFVIALRQARARYSAAVDTRTLQEQLLGKEQQKFLLGASTINNVVVVQRSLATARAAEVAALSTYSRARVSLDQVLGETLEKNNISVGEALEGRVAHNSTLPSP
jgi:hypothetical protein